MLSSFNPESLTDIHYLSFKGVLASEGDPTVPVCSGMKHWSTWRIFLLYSANCWGLIAVHLVHFLHWHWVDSPSVDMLFRSLHPIKYKKKIISSILSARIIYSSCCNNQFRSKTGFIETNSGYFKVNVAFLGGRGISKWPVACVDWEWHLCRERRLRGYRHLRRQSNTKSFSLCSSDIFLSFIDSILYRYVQRLSQRGHFSPF